MPLHLLGKKSWNVYNTANISRVRRDEAAASAREAAEEQSMQEADAHRRMQLLRGEPADRPVDQADNDHSTTQVNQSPDPNPDRLGLDSTYHDRDRKRKRRHGEDDTDRDMRYAKRVVEERVGGDEEWRLVRAGRLEDGVELVDGKGHINLFPEEAAGPRRGDMRVAKGGEKEGRRERREREKEEREKRREEVPVMRMVEAAGRAEEGRSANPWYATGGRGGEDGGGGSGDDARREQLGKDVWGNEDPGRKARDQARVAVNDPLAVMMAGVRQVRKVEADRKKWQMERDEEVRSMQKDEERRRRRRRERRRQEEEADELEGFSLDAGAEGQRRHHHYHGPEHKRSKHRGAKRKGSRPVVSRRDERRD